MSASNDLIERLEAETGQRIDDNNGDNNAMAGLFGAISRIMGQSPPSFTERDDVVAGLFIRHQMSSEGRREKERKGMVAAMLASGMSLDDIGDFLLPQRALEK